MARRPGVYGPYPHRSRWRVVIVNARGIQTAESCATQEEAERLKRELDRELDKERGLTVQEAIDAYEVHLRHKRKPRSVDTTVGRLEMFFGPLIVRPMAWLTPPVCRERYGALMPTCAPDTHLNALSESKAFAKWCCTTGYLRRSPLEDLKGEGKKHAGKPQLRIDEARKWIIVALGMAERDHRAAAACVTLLLGVRASEVAERVVRDLDDDGHLLWIPDSKTDAGRRTLEVPGPLRTILLALAHGRDPGDRLFPRVSRWVVRGWVQRICTLAGVPVVSAHAMRGLHSTIAVHAGATSHLVASALGHASKVITERHYLDGEIAGQAKQRAALRALSGGRRGKR